MVYFIIAAVLMLYGAMNFYVGSRIFFWLKLIWPVLPVWLFALLYVFLASSIFVGYLIPVSGPAKAFHLISNYWLAIFLYLLLAIIIIDFFYFVGRFTAIGSIISTSKALISAGLIVLLLVCLLLAIGTYTGNNVKIKEYDVSILKNGGARDELNLILISDLHLGYTVGEKHVNKLVKEINRLNPDIVCIAGDTFDNHYASIENIEGIIEHFRSIKSVYGVYACLGNHDVDMRADNNDEMIEFFKKAGIVLLQDQGVLVDDSFYIAGRLDLAPIGIKNHKRKPIKDIIKEFDKSKPIIVLDHRPVELAEVAAGGSDLLLSGHTHKGQIFPGNLVTRRIFDIDYGYKKEGNLHIVVTSGAGIWGPPLRLGTQTEIVKINIKFTCKTAG